MYNEFHYIIIQCSQWFNVKEDTDYEVSLIGMFEAIILKLIYTTYKISN